MSAFRRDNLIRFSWLLILTLVLITPGLSASFWRCFDGSLCQPGCSHLMGHASKDAPIKPEPSTQGQHDCCLKQPSASINASTISGSFTSGCYLQVQPSSELQGQRVAVFHLEFNFDLTAALPELTLVQFEEQAPRLLIHSLPRPPNGFITVPDSPRAPPVLA